ncbi:flagellin [Roseinatronobacter sp.]|uniref:flagellin n=1 Tax=Roseinatronobacter sp. TaxID=1945755 RepID=UPI0025DA3B21|nr:flagellin [Rhodobaca sp.]
MLPNTFGDMAQRLTLQRHGSGLKRAVSNLAQELTTGIAKDKSLKVKGDFSALSGVSSALEMASARKANAQLAGILFSSQQTILLDLGKQAQSGLLEGLMRSGTLNETEISIGILQMEERFRRAVSQLNTQIGGRAIFAGTATDGAALATADTMLDAIFEDLIATYPGGPDAETTSAFISSWFADGGNFELQGYVGGSKIPARLDLGNGISVGMDLTAEDESIRTHLSALATGAILSKGLFASDRSEQHALLGYAAQSLSHAHRGLIALSAKLGIEEERAETGRFRAEAEHTALSIARAELLESDPYEAAVRLEQAMTQLDLIYNLTARLSRLSLATYLR